jgi:hypothetical protein
MKVGNVYVILLGAEGCAELQEKDYIGCSTEEEIKAFKNALISQGKCTEEQINNSMVDANGRPYWFMTIEESAPEYIKKAALGMRRLRLTY